MTSRESEIERMLEDEDAWERPERSTKKKSERRQRGVMVSVRLTAEEMSRLQAAARERGVTVAAFIRERAIGSGGSASLTVGMQLPSENTTGPHSRMDVILSSEEKTQYLQAVS